MTPAVKAVFAQLAAAIVALPSHERLDVINLIAAMRGPDHDPSFTVKYHTTEIIRRLVFPELCGVGRNGIAGVPWDVAYESRTTIAELRKGYRKIRAITDSPVSDHFLDHITYAIEALERDEPTTQPTEEQS